MLGLIILSDDIVGGFINFVIVHKVSIQELYLSFWNESHILAYKKSRDVCRGCGEVGGR